MIKYLGSKRLLLGSLVEVLRSVPELTSVIDLFSGTARCGHAFKRAGYRVVCNDHNAYAHTLGTCYVAADRERVVAPATRLLRELDALPGRPGYFTETFCVRSRFFQPHNGERVDAIRERIGSLSLDPELEAVLLVSLMEAADRVDSTCGLQMAYVKQWAPRSFQPLRLRMPDVLPSVAAGPCRAVCLDANEAATGLEGDVAYLDPPYNQHSYLGNYHIWETLVRWDKPAVYGVACKRVDCRTRKSDYNSRRRHRAAFAGLIGQLRASLIVVSFSDEGFQSKPAMEALLAERGQVFVVTKGFKRYVGAQIGVHDPAGNRVGSVSHLRNEEYLYLVATPELLRRLPDARERLARVAQRVTETASPGRTADGAAADGATALAATALAARAADGVRPREERVRAALLAGAATLEELDQRTRLSGYQLRTALALMSARGEVFSDGGGRARRYRLAECAETRGRPGLGPGSGPGAGARTGSAFQES